MLLYLNLNLTSRRVFASQSIKAVYVPLIARAVATQGQKLQAAVHVPPRPIQGTEALITSIQGENLGVITTSIAEGYLVAAGKNISQAAFAFITAISTPDQKKD